MESGSKSWLISSRGIAKKVKSATRSSDSQIRDCGANRECPNCQFRIDNSDVFPEWPGLPLGVKFEPSDEQLVEHLAAKCGSEDKKPHMFIDEFIPTLDKEGIYSDHPENLPGANKDGNSIHFFHKIVNAYATGQRKRRKVQGRCGGPAAEHVRWHKTGKTKPVIENGVQKGWKKILVLYKSTTKGSKPDKTNWVMHQYHLGTAEDEKEGEFVVSKICYQKPKNLDSEPDDKGKTSLVVEVSDFKAPQTSPTTPISNPPIPPRRENSLLCEDIADNYLPPTSATEGWLVQEAILNPKNDVQLQDDISYPAWFAGESQTVEDSGLNAIDDSLLCKEIFDPIDNYYTHNTNFTCTGSKFIGDGTVADLQNIELGTPPDIELTNLQFCSQDSLFNWFDRL